MLDRWLAARRSKPEITFHLSPGTPAMAAIWIILAKTRYGAELIEILERARASHSFRAL